MEIIKIPDPRLRVKSQKITQINDEVRQDVENMIAASLEWEKDHPHEISAAMAAPQIGINKRLIIARDDTSDKNNTGFTALINPEVIRASNKVAADYEGCLSVPDLYGLVERPTEVKIKAKLIDGNEVRIKAKDSLARMLLHEIDHLDGILFIDHVKPGKDSFARLDQDGELEPLDYDEVRSNPTYFPEES